MRHHTSHRPTNVNLEVPLDQGGRDQQTNHSNEWNGNYNQNVKPHTLPHNHYINSSGYTYSYYDQCLGLSYHLAAVWLMVAGNLNYSVSHTPPWCLLTPNRNFFQSNKCIPTSEGIECPSVHWKLRG